MTLPTDKNPTWLADSSSEELRRIVDVLYRVHHFISAITDLDTLLERIMAESRALAHAEACSLMLYDPDGEELYFRVALGEKGDQQLLKREIRLKLGQGIAGAAAETRQAINVENVQKDERFYGTVDQKTHFETRSILAVPLLDHEKLIGVLEVLNKEDGEAFSEADLRVMEIFSTAVATAIANARLIEENIRAERLAAIGEAVAGLSHHAKNIITGMGGSVDLIEHGVETSDSEVLQRCLPILRRSSKRMSNFVEDMLAFSKPRTPLREECDMSRLLQEVTESFWGLLARRNVELVVDTEALAGPFLLDPRGMYRCLLNLLMNAAEAVPSEGGTIWLNVRTGPQGRLEIDVADSGPGIPEELRDTVCDPFYSTKGSQGTGLGLAVTRKIVQEHGGALRIGESDAGGALIQIRLPVCKE